MSDWYVLGDDARSIRPVKRLPLPTRAEDDKPHPGATWARVAETYVTPSIRVSTVFLGLDHRFGEGPPLVFETMVFGGPLDQDVDRYTTWEEAEAGHAVLVDRCRSILHAAFIDVPEEAR